MLLRYNARRSAFNTNVPLLVKYILNSDLKSSRELLNARDKPIGVTGVFKMDGYEFLNEPTGEAIIDHANRRFENLTALQCAYYNNDSDALKLILESLPADQKLFDEYKRSLLDQIAKWQNNKNHYGINGE